MRTTKLTPEECAERRRVYMKNYSSKYYSEHKENWSGYAKFGNLISVYGKDVIQNTRNEHGDDEALNILKNRLKRDRLMKRLAQLEVVCVM